MRDMRNAHYIIFGNPEGNRELGRPKHRFEDKIK
jgi:hypothetical protein